ncbi:MAG TPA: hypothetical protein VNI54_13155 [Thermoanaerobaculia bacterium]|nr:hypothetical protein [Thermoanaerobaculia bacterium]
MIRTIARVILAAMAVMFLVSFVTDIVTALKRSRQKRTMADMRSIATGLEALATDRKGYNIGPVRRLPRGTMHRVPFAEVERALVPVYMKSVPRLDGWGEPFRIYVGGYDEKGRARDMLIRSFGSDRRAKGSFYTIGKTRTMAEDLVFSAGNFVRYPGRS